MRTRPAAARRLAAARPVAAGQASDISSDAFVLGYSREQGVRVCGGQRGAVGVSPACPGSRPGSGGADHGVWRDQDRKSVV